jgi:small basic protein
MVNGPSSVPSILPWTSLEMEVCGLFKLLAICREIFALLLGLSLGVGFYLGVIVAIQGISLFSSSSSLRMLIGDSECQRATRWPI